MKFSIKNIKFSIKNMKFSIKNTKFSVYEVCQNSSFVVFVTEFSYHMYRKNAALNGKQKQMKPLHIILSFHSVSILYRTIILCAHVYLILKRECSFYFLKWKWLNPVSVEFLVASNDDGVFCIFLLLWFVFLHPKYASKH